MVLQALARKIEQRPDQPPHLVREAPRQQRERRITALGLIQAVVLIARAVVYPVPGDQAEVLHQQVPPRVVHPRFGRHDIHSGRQLFAPRRDAPRPLRRVVERPRPAGRQRLRRNGKGHRLARRQARDRPPTFPPPAGVELREPFAGRVRDLAARKRDGRTVAHSDGDGAAVALRQRKLHVHDSVFRLRRFGAGECLEPVDLPLAHRPHLI